MVRTWQQNGKRNTAQDCNAQGNIRKEKKEEGHETLRKSELLKPHYVETYQRVTAGVRSVAVRIRKVTEVAETRIIRKRNVNSNSRFDNIEAYIFKLRRIFMSKWTIRNRYRRVTSLNTELTRCMSSGDEETYSSFMAFACT